jgi:homoserine dehydrogenase
MFVTRVALLGFGTVGSVVARRLLDQPDLALTHIFDRRAAEKAEGPRGLALASHAAAGSVSTAGHSPAPRPPLVWTSRFEDVVGSGADIVVEAVGGLEPALEWARRVLAAGKSVVTANKQLVAWHGPELWALAARQGRQFRFEAAVGGAMPIVRAIADGLAGERITRIVAILNGTTNAVLSRMEVLGCSLHEALAEARARGYAEADPRADLDGDDARAKLAILSGLAFGVRVTPREIPVRSTSAIEPADFLRARQRRGTIRQLAYAAYHRERAALSAWVGPVVVARDSVFGRAAGPQNAALLTGEHAGEVGIFGAGAGGDATAGAILGDVRAIARDRAAIVPAPRLTSAFSLEDAGAAGSWDLFELAEAV